MITLKNIDKTFYSKTSFQAIKDVSLTIKEGEIFGIIGPSGAGKSTLLKMMSVLLEPTKGSIYIDQKDIYDLTKSTKRDILKDIGVVYQRFHLFMQKTVYQNISIPLIIQNYDKTEIKKRVDHLLEAFELSDKKDNYPTQLSGGQQQRIAIARALSYEPKVLLLDEITSSLDILTSNQILKLIKDIHQKLNITIILITHDMNVVKQICDRVAIIDCGYLVEAGTIEEIFKNPKTEITKKLIGASHYERL